ncbi:MAG TPA: hypothetical protein VH141_32720 [Pseudonocardia sp.]|jgi:hypothetical protein|nr:hypothetical protein [Pseudonocardia sp.]
METIMVYVPQARDLFADAKTPLEMLTQFEDYKQSLNKSFQRHVPAPYSPEAELSRSLDNFTLNKSVSPELLASVRQSLDFMGKDLTVAGPGSTGGLQAFDLEAPSKKIAPRMTPIRNKIPRIKGVGTSHRYKRITGWSNSGTGGVSDLWMGITETGTNSVGGQTLRRGPVITLAGDQANIPYCTFSASNVVTWEAQYSGLGYEDLRQLSQTALLYSSMLFEEKALIESRGTVSPFSGGLGAPTGVAVVNAAPGTGQTATTGITGNAWAVVTAVTRWGETPISSAAHTSFTTGNTTTVSWNPVVGGYAYNVYLGSGSSDPTTAAYWLQRPNAGTFTTSATSVSFSGAITTSGTAASTVNVSDTTASATGYDGILATVLGADSGYVNHVNGTLSSNAGNEIQTVCASIFDAVKGQPQEVLCNGYDRKQLSDLLKSTSNGSAYRITVDSAAQSTGGVHDATIGALVSGIQNEVTGDFLDVTVNPWWPQGTMGVMSWTLPVPASEISTVWAVVGPQDYMGIEWPQTQFTFDCSSWWMNSLVCYAPEFNGAVTGIVRS